MARISMYHVELVKDSSHNYKVSRDMSTPSYIYDLLITVLHLDKRNVECFGVIVVNTKNELMAVQILTQGTINATMAQAREVFQIALLHNGHSVILFHNHPSGDATPSCEDKQVTHNMIEAGKIIGIEVLDHIIVGENEYYSMLANGDF